MTHENFIWGTNIHQLSNILKNNLELSIHVSITNTQKMELILKFGKLFLSKTKAHNVI